RDDHGEYSDGDDHQVDEQREVVGGGDAEAGRVAVPEQHRGGAGAGQADDGEAAERHPFTLAAKGFSQHHHETGEGDADDGDDGVEGVTEHDIGPVRLVRLVR